MGEAYLRLLVSLIRQDPAYRSSRLQIVFENTCNGFCCPLDNYD